MASGGSSYLVPGLILVALSIILAVLYLLRRLRMRQKSTPSETDPRRYVEDRAYNQLQLTRAAAGRLERDGVDLTRVHEVLAEAEKRLERRDFDGALGSARAAQQLLGRIREQSAGGAPAPPPAPGFDSAEPIPAPQPTRWMAAAARAEPDSPPDFALPSSPNPSAADDGASRVRVPKNRIAAQFELKLLGEEIERAPVGSARNEAEQVRQQAQAAADRSDYTESLRLALRGRRSLGVQLETVPLPATRAAAAEERASAPLPSRAAASSLPCPRCGRANSAADRFCRACGAPLKGPQCRQCGSPVTPEDQFCGVCGAPLA
jgi:double zinc ribbon protein